MSRKMRKALRELQEGMDKLAEDQGRIARKNAREKVMKSLRVLRASLDQDYPHIRKKPKKRSAPRKRFPAGPIPNGWVELSAYAKSSFYYNNWIAAILEAKVPCKRSKNSAVGVLVPEWVVAVGPTVSKLVAAKKSRRERNHALAAWKLTQTGGNDTW